MCTLTLRTATFAPSGWMDRSKPTLLTAESTSTSSAPISRFASTLPTAAWNWTLPPNFSSSVHIGTNNGPITLRMAEGTNARISARTSNASIDTDFEVRAQGELSRNRLEGAIGSGGPLIDLSTSNGSIHLLKK